MVEVRRVKMTTIYVDYAGKRYIQSRSVGYEEYAHIKSDGTLGICGGNVGPSAGWQTVLPKDQSKEDREFVRTIVRLRVGQYDEAIHGLQDAKKRLKTDGSFS